MKKHLPKKAISRLLAMATVAAPLASVASVTTINLTTANATSGPVAPLGGVIFHQGAIGAGTGNFDPFLQVDGKDTIDGYSTDAGPAASTFTQYISDPHTHSLTYGDLRYVTVNSTDYVRFLLDINEPNGGNNANLVLSDLRIYAPTAAPGASATFSGDINAPASNLGTPIFSLGDYRVLLNYDLEAGSGYSDMEFLVPVSLFSSVTSTNTRILFYSEFGDTTGLDSSLKGYADDNGGFEEWRFSKGDSFVPPPPPPPPVPEPATFAFAGVLVAGLVGAELRRRRKV